MEPLTAIASAAALKKGVEIMLTTIGRSAGEGLPAKLNKWKAAKSIKGATDRLSQVRMVKTIWQIDRAVDLLNFYYPSKLMVGDERRQISRLEDVPCTGNVVIQGTVGQGKSIFLRYLTTVEAVDGTCLPLFVELRRIRAGENLLDYVIREICALELVADLEVFEYLAARGLILLFLDAFDEVKEERRQELVTELELLARKHPALRIVITSRPGTGIERSTAFRVFELCQLDRTDLDGVIMRVCDDTSTATRIIAGLTNSGHPIYSLLTTPLMVALLVLRYRADQSIPENHVAFFSDLFALLLQRHDKSKAGYIRARKSGIGDKALESVFVALSYLSRKRGESVFTSAMIYDLTREALNAADIVAKADDVLDDIRAITCLLLEEGGEYRFIHNIVQEYHASCFVSRQPEEAAQKFYVAMQTRWPVWNEELRFLETIDSYRCLKWFVIPMYEDFFQGTNNDTAVSEMLSWCEISLSSVNSISFRYDSDDKFQWVLDRILRRGGAFTDLALPILREARIGRLPPSLMPEEGNKQTSHKPLDLIELPELGSLLIAEGGKMYAALCVDMEKAKKRTQVVESQRSLLEF